MRIVCLITVGAFLLTIAIAAEADEQVRENVPRVPRALILRPVVKVRQNDDDEGPLDWLANMFRPKRKPPPPMLGPIRIPGLDDEVYIKQLSSMANANHRVVVRIVNPQPMAPLATPVTQPVVSVPTSYYYETKPMFPVVPTRPISSGFSPMSSPVPTPQWPRPHAVRQPQFPVNYKNLQSGYNFSPQHYYQPPHQYPLNYPHYHQPYSPRYPQTPYGTYDFDNSIQHSGRHSHYAGDPPRSTNYPVYPPLNEAIDGNRDTQEIRNHTVSEEVYDDSRESEIRYDDENRVTPTPSKVTDTFKEVYRPDRMVPTNPTWRNRFWTRTFKTTTSTTTEPSTSEEKSFVGKFSSTEIREIEAPNLKDWKSRQEKAEKEKNSDSRMDEGVKGGATLARGESQEHDVDLPPTETSRIFKKPTRNRNDWRPIESSPTQQKPVYTSPPTQSTLSTQTTEKTTTTTTEVNTPRVDSATPEVIQKVMSLTSTNQWKHQDLKRPSKTYQRKNGGINNSNRRVRIVESVRSSVSVTSSRGKLPKSKSNT